MEHVYQSATDISTKTLSYLGEDFIFQDIY